MTLFILLTRSTRARIIAANLGLLAADSGDFGFALGAHGGRLIFTAGGKARARGRIVASLHLRRSGARRRRRARGPIAAAGNFENHIGDALTNDLPHLLK